MKSFQELFNSSSGEPRLRNLTPHPVRLFVFPPVNPGNEETYRDWEWEEIDGKLGQWVEYAPESPPARMGETDGEVSVVTAGVEEATFGMIVDVQASVVERDLQAPELPEPDARFRYIVSLPLLMGLQAAGIHRDDLVAPDTGSGAVRDDQGRIVGVKQLVRLKPNGPVEKA